MKSNSPKKRIRTQSLPEDEITPRFALSTNIMNQEFKVNEDLKWITNDDIEYPNYFDIICYYFKSIFNNNNNKFQYLIFKSKTYTLINRGTILFANIQEAQTYCDEENNFNNNEIDTEIINIFQLSDQYLKENSKLLGLSQAPFKEFVENYLYKRNILLKLDDNFKDKYTDNRFVIAKRTTYIVNQLEILFEFVKSSVDKNDEIPFKILVLTMNFFILLGEYLWKYYWLDGSDSIGDN